MRALGIDLGSRRIGIAVSDADGRVATPYETIERCGEERRDHDRIGTLAAEAGAEQLVVGLPVNMDGSLGPAARKARAEADRLGARTGLPVDTYDERLTTVTAERALQEQGVRGRARRKVVDQVAAAVLLQAWLDGRPSGPAVPPAEE